MALLRLLVTAGLLLLGCVAAEAHATLIGSDPGDGAILDEAPTRLVLTFNEPVSPLALRLVASDGTITPLDRYHLADAALVIEAPAGIGSGTYALSWRVVSMDGHPIGGSVLFSVGAPISGVPPDTSEDVDWPLRLAMTVARVLIYVGLFFGVGGLFFQSFVAPAPPAARRLQDLALVAALIALPISVGLQGLDALDRPLPDLAELTVWRAGFETSYGNAALIGAFALLAVLFGYRSNRAPRRLVAAVSLGAVGLALASTGHASAAPPQWFTRPAVFTHGVAVAVWAGSLLPLGFLLARGDASACDALRRFSRMIPYAVVPLVLTGLVLAVIQIGSLEAIWTTAYGRVFVAKLLLLAALFGLAAINRWRLTAPAMAGETGETRRLLRSVAIEIGLVIAILFVVALWRFTPPPRSLDVAPERPASVHLHASEVAAALTIAPGRAGPVVASIVVMSVPASGPLDPMEVTLALSLPSTGIEPMRRSASRVGDGSWRVDGLTIPQPGRWSVEVAILVSDFELVRLEGSVEIRP